MLRRMYARGTLLVLLIALISLSFAHRTATPSAAAASCVVSYKVINQWADGFIGDVTVTNNLATTTTWQLSWTFAGNQRIVNLWNGVLTQTNTAVSVQNAAWNGSLVSGGSVNVGFQATFSGTNSIPTSFTLNGVVCGETSVTITPATTSPTNTVTTHPIHTNTPTQRPPTNTPTPPTGTPRPSNTPTVAPTTPTSTPSNNGCVGAIICDDFENQTGIDPSGFWQALYPDCTGHGSVMVDNTYANSGSKSIMVHGHSNFCDHAFFGNTTAIESIGNLLYGRFYVRQDLALPDHHITLMALKDRNDADNDLRLGGQQSVLDWNRESDDATAPSMSSAGIAKSVTIPPRQWTCVEFKIDSANGYLQAWVNGSEVEGMRVDGVDTPDVDQVWHTRANWQPRLVDFRLGWESYGGDDITHNIWFDDVALATQRIGCSASNPTTPTATPRPTNTTTPAVGTLTPSPIPSATPTIAPNGITAATTIAELCPTYRQLYIDRDFLDYLPSDGSGGHNNMPVDGGLTDAQKASLYGVNISAIQSKVGNGTLTLGDLGTQALGHVQRLVNQNFPKNAICQLLPRLMLLGPETEAATFHKNSSNPWDETAGPVNAIAPAGFMQTRWPTDARTYVPAEKAERDRCHDQPIHENNLGWTFSSIVDSSILYDPNNPVLNAIRTNTHPISGLPMGSGFSSNAPMQATTKLHEENSGFWYQVIQFKNTSNIPYYLDCAMIWWVGPSGLSFDLRNGHYNNEQRPGRGYGHPQRDIIEVVYDQAQKLSVYSIRLSFHDEPYNMRTAYPNQYWSLEVGTPAFLNGQARYTTSAERQALMDLMLNTLHVELETDLDRNIELFDALKMRNRVSN